MADAMLLLAGVLIFFAIIFAVLRLIAGRTVVDRVAVEHHILAGGAQLRVDRIIDIELPRIDDRHVEASGDRVIEEHAVHRAAYRLVAAEGEAEVR